MSLPTGAEVASFLGRSDDTALVSLAGEHVLLVVEFVKSYTRGVGFDVNGFPEDDVRAVIITSTARLVTNPTQDKREQIGDYSRVPTVEGWTLPELAVLHRYRRRTA